MPDVVVPVLGWPRRFGNGSALCPHHTFSCLTRLTMIVACCFFLVNIDNGECGKSEARTMAWILLIVESMVFVIHCLTAWITCNLKFLDPTDNLVCLLQTLFGLHVPELALAVWMSYSLVENPSCIRQPNTQKWFQILQYVVWICLAIPLCLVFTCTTTVDDDYELDQEILLARMESRFHYGCGVCCWNSNTYNGSSVDVTIKTFSEILFKIWQSKILGMDSDHQHLTTLDYAMGINLVGMLENYFNKPPRKSSSSLNENLLSPSPTSSSPLLPQLPSSSEKAALEDIERGLRENRTKLVPHEQNIIRQADHYFMYAEAAYGLPIYLFDHMSCEGRDCCLLCNPIVCCCMPPCDIETERIHGTSCGWSGCDMQSFEAHSGLRGEDILRLNRGVGLHSVVYYVCVDREKQAVVIAIRGTLSWQDGCTDLDCKQVLLSKYLPAMAGIENVYVHNGISESAQKIFDEITHDHRIMDFLQNNPEYKPVVVGHSLGAGAAFMLTVFLRNMQLTVKCHQGRASFKQAVSGDFNCEEYINEFVYHHDIIPRLSFTALLDMIAAINLLIYDTQQSTCWILNWYGCAETEAEAVFGKTHKYLKDGGEADFRFSIAEMRTRFFEAQQELCAEDNRYDLQPRHKGLLFHLAYEDDTWGCGLCGKDDYEVQRVIPEYYDRIHVSRTMMLDHLPRYYKRALRAVCETLPGNEV